MKTQMNMVMGLITAALISNCGAKKSTDSTSATPSTAALASDASLAGGVVNAHYSDALSAAVDQGSSSASLSDGGTSSVSGDKNTDTSNVTKTCAVDGLNAVVKISSAINREEDKTQGGGKVTIKRIATGDSTMTRTWSRTDGTAVVCKDTSSAAVNMKSPAGLKLNVDFSRTRNLAVTATTTKGTKDWGRDMSITGTREITWAANTTSSDSATSYFRNKTISSSVKKSMHVKDKDGTEQSLDLQIATKSDAPMVVQVERQVSDNSVLSRSIVSGTVIASKSDGSIEATYTNLKVSLASDECKVASGSASFVFKDSAGTTLKTYTLSVDSTSGDSVLKDDSGNSVDDFAIDACDAEDLKI